MDPSYRYPEEGTTGATGTVVPSPSYPTGRSKPQPPHGWYQQPVSRWRGRLRAWSRVAGILLLGAVLGLVGYRGYIIWTQYTVLWAWATNADQRLRAVEARTTDMRPGSPLPPGARIEDGEKYGFPKGTKVTIMPPESTSPPAPSK